MRRTLILTVAMALTPACAFASSPRDFPTRAAYEEYKRKERLGELASVPADFGTYFYRGRIYAGQSKHELALENFNTSIRMNPKFAQAHFRRGLALYRLNKKEEGLADMEKSLGMDPRMTDAQIFFAVHTGDKNKAIAAAKAACEVTRYENEICMQVLAWVYARGGDFDNAVRWQKKAIEKGVFGVQRADERLESYQKGTFPESNPPYWHFLLSE